MGNSNVANHSRSTSGMIYVISSSNACVYFTFLHPRVPALSASFISPTRVLYEDCTRRKLIYNFYTHMNDETMINHGRIYAVLALSCDRTSEKQR